MKSNLEKISEVIQQSNHLTVQQRTKIEESLKQAEEELQAKDRELQIESCLEKVREIALSMKNPFDMLEICKTISAQLQALGVKEIRNVQTAIFHEERGTYYNYEYYDKHKKTVFTETNYKDHPVATQFAEQMIKGAGVFFSHSFNKDELKDWIIYQKGTNVFIDSFLETAPSLHYYWFSLGPVALGMSTYIALNENEINLFKRFIKVFELSYRRYLDIKQAEAQAREAQIETSLERVRAVALGMHTADDLLNICETLFRELLTLGFSEMRNAMINIHNDEQKTFINYDYSDEIGKSTNHLTYTIHTLVEKQIKKIRSANDAFSETYFTGNDLEEWKNFRKRIGEKDDPRLNDASGLYYYFYSIGIGSIGISTFGPINEEKIGLLKRFRNVFHLSYQRYTDIANAEAQAKEAKLEASLEKVRAQAMAMHTTAELKSVGETIYQEIKSLGFNEIRNTEIIINNDIKENILSHYCDYGISGTLEVDYKTNPILKKWAEEMKSASDAFTTVVISEKEIDDWRKFREEIGYQPDAKLDAASSVYYYSYSTGLGALSVSSFLPLNDEQKKILERFRNVFTLAYRRYNDVASAEAHAKQSLIEGQKLREEKERADKLLLNILPAEIAEELKQFGKSYARKHEEVTILFADIKGFSSIAEKLSAQELVTQLDECFRAFDHIVEKHGLEKIKTVGDAYVCACGLPRPVTDHAAKTIRAAIDMINFIKGFSITRTIQDLPAFDFRIGINTGPVVTGVVGLKKFTYDIWGDAVNMAARMEQHGEAGKINISENTYALVKDQFKFTPRGKILAKNKGEIEMFFVQLR